MVDQVNPMGSLATGTTPILVAAVKTKQVPDKSPPAKAAEVQPTGLDALRTKASPQEAEQAVKDLNDYLKNSGSDLRLQKDNRAQAITYSDLVFQVDKSTGTFLFKIVDSKTKEVIRQVPSEEVLAMARKLRELSGRKDASGVLVDKEG